MDVKKLFILLTFTAFLAPSCASKNINVLKTNQQASIPNLHEYQRPMFNRD